MSFYREEPITGSKWRRSHFVTIENPAVGEKAITYHEQEVKLLNDGSMSDKPAGSIRQPYAPELAGTVFQLRNPTDDSVIVGATATYQDVYVLLHSLYLHLATMRDAPPQPELPL